MMTEQEIDEELAKSTGAFHYDRDLRNVYEWGLRDATTYLKGRPTILVALLPELAQAALLNMRSILSDYDPLETLAERDFVARQLAGPAVALLAALDEVVPS